MNRNEKNVNKLTMLGMMTALVFVSNYLRITMPIAIGGRHLLYSGQHHVLPVRLAAGACGRFCLRLGFRHL